MFQHMRQYQSSFNPRLGSPAPGKMFVACRAEVPSNNTAYFSPTFRAPAVSRARKDFRELVTTQYGPVSNLQCAGKFNQAVVNEQVEKWKDSARSTKNAIVDTDWQPTAARDQGAGAPQPQSPYAVSYQHASGGFPPGPAVPGNANLGTTSANQRSFQR